MSTRTIVILVVIGLVLVAVLRPGSAQTPPPAAAPPNPGAGGGFPGGAVSDLLKGPASNFFGSGGALQSFGDVAKKAGIPIPSPSPTATAPSSPSPTLGFSVPSPPGTDWHQGILRGYGRMFSSHGQNIGAYPASDLTAKGFTNLTPGANGARWNYSEPAFGPAPTIPEWEVFDQQRRSLLGL